MKLFKGKKKFKASDHKDMDDFEPIPSDWYEGLIVKGEYKKNNKEDGHLAALTAKITQGEYKGRLFFINLNLDNPSDEAVQRAEKELATICRAIGIPTCEDTEELLNIPMELKVGPKPASGGYPAGNKINGYRKIGSGSEKPGKSGKKDKKKKGGKKDKPKVSFD